MVVTAYLLGVSTRRVEKLAESLGVTQLSKSQVSAMARRAAETVPTVPAAAIKFAIGGRTPAVVLIAPPRLGKPLRLALGVGLAEDPGCGA